MDRVLRVSAETVSKKLVLLLPRPVDQDHRLDPVARCQRRDPRLGRLTSWMWSSGGRPFGSEKPLERDCEIQVPARPQPSRAERVEPGQLAPLTELEPGGRVRPDHDVGVALRGDGDLAVTLAQLDRPAQTEIVELDAIARLEAGAGSQVALGKGGECILHFAQPPMLCDADAWIKATSDYRPERLFPPTQFIAS